VREDRHGAGTKLDDDAAKAVPTVLHDDVGHVLAGAAQALGSHELVALNELGLDLRSYGVLALAAEASLGQLEISDLTGIDRSTVVVVVDRLVEAGLVTRRQCSRDRRIRIVEPTERGRRLAADAVQRVRAIEAEFLSPLDEAERAAFLGFVRRIATGPLGRPADLSGVSTTPRRRPRRGDPG
jgi:DNA-binding MarR family transcriptional regulator